MCQRSLCGKVACLATLCHGGLSLALVCAFMLASHVVRAREATAQAGSLTTVAGTGTPGFNGDGPALSVQLCSPIGLALDSSRNVLYFADDCNHRIRQLDLGTETITTVAGTGTPGFNGDGPALSVRMNYPGGLALDGSGNLFFTDDCNHRIRKLNLSTQMITTVAGSGPTGCGAGGFGGDGGLATSAQLFLPSAVVVDGSGNLFIADRANNRVRKVVPGADGIITGASDEIITTVAGTGAPGFSGDGGPATSAQLFQPYGLALDGSGSLFIADRFNNRVRKVVPGADGIITGASDEIITTVAGSGLIGINVGGFGGDEGPATSAKLFEPSSLTFDGSGNLFIGDVANRRVRRVVPGADGIITGASDEIITTVAGTGAPGFNGDGPATSVNLQSPYGLAVDESGNLFIADEGNHRVRKVLEDECPNSNLSTTIVIDGCNSGVPNTLFASGCTVSDLIAACADGASDHGQFVSCVAGLTNALKKSGTITGQQKGAIQSCAAQADLP